MNFVYGFWLAALGVLGASSLIIARRPDAADMIAKMAPYQGWLGAVSAFWGLWGIISSVLSIGMMASNFLWWVTILSDSVVQLSLGLLLGVGVLKTFIKDPTANAKMDETIKKLSPFQGTLGLVAIGLALWTIVGSVLFF
jgi:hypothetical protein